MPRGLAERMRQTMPRSRIPGIGAEFRGVQESTWNGFPPLDGSEDLIVLVHGLLIHVLRVGLCLEFV